MSVTDTSPLAKGSYEPVAWNFKLLAQHELQGFGGMGEGMSIQIAPDGRRILWLAHESAPKNFTGVDVSDPRKPKVVVQTDLPQSYMRSNSLETTDNLMAVAYQTQKVGLKPAGFELFDISVPEKPKSIAFVDCSWPAFTRRASSSGSATASTFTCRPARPTSHPRIPTRRSVLPHLRRAQSVEAGRGIGQWWLPGTAGRRRPPPPERHPQGAVGPRQPRPQHQRLSESPGPLLSRLSSMPACSSWTFPTNRSPSRSPAGTIPRPSPASPTPSCRCSTATSSW